MLAHRRVVAPHACLVCPRFVALSYTLISVDVGREDVRPDAVSTTVSAA
jgi:hypothetical protein